MKKLVALSVLVLALAATSTANAQSVLRLPHKPWSQMTHTQKITYLQRQIRHDRSIIRFFKHHRTIRTVESQRAIRFAHVSLPIASTNLHKLMIYRRVFAVGFPPHHALWMCIHSNEGPWNDNDGGYDGGLQMSQSWGHGIVGSAGNYTQQQQEWAAERGYQQGGIPFLYQQWFKWDNADYCIKYA